MNTIEIPKTKLIVSAWPNSAADAIPVKIVATVEEYFFKIVSASIKKTDLEKHKENGIVNMIWTQQTPPRFIHFSVI